MTRTALGLLAIAKAGIRDDEMVELLSQCADVLTEVFQYSNPGIQRLPDHVYWRLSSGLENLTIKRDNDCVNYCHRQLWETAQERYTGDRGRLQSLMGIYFTDNVSARDKEKGLLSSQPLTLNGKLVWYDNVCVDQNEATRRRQCIHLLTSNSYRSL